MRKNYRMKNIFADKASLVLRKMLKDSERRWVVRDFTGPEGISLGMSQEVLKAMEKKGYIERVKKGPDSHTILTNKEQLISDWLKEYHFNLNTIDTYYSSDNLIHPFYKNSLFFNTQKIKDYNMVSNLQLYLDLYNFQPRGREQAEYLRNLLEEKGRNPE